MIPILALYAVLAMTFTVGKMLLSFMTPLWLNGLRMTLAGSVILAIYYWYHRRIAIQKKDVALFGIVSLVHIFIPYTTEFIALERLSPSCVALFFNLTPCFTALFSYFFFHEVMTWRKIIGFAIGLGGIWYIMQPVDWMACGICFDYVYVFTSVISCSLGWVLFRILLTRGYNALLINGVAMLSGGILSLVSAVAVEPKINISSTELPMFLFLFFSIILLANVIFYNAYGYLLKKYSATLLSFIGFFTPLITAVYDWAFLGIHVQVEFYIATVIVAYGIYIFYQEELRQGYVA